MKFKKLRTIDILISIFLCIVYVLSFFNSTSIYAAESNNTYANKEETEIKIVLEKAISPGVLPGEDESAGKNKTDSWNSIQKNHLSTNTDLFPKTGSKKNSWIFIGTFLLITVFLYMSFNKKRKEGV
ncbi:LPXTG cell wall anchor domain-containing protein [Enterococcus casseliflavus]|uniref:LPXTG cell wall anchor domain-containing protein n=1 Tax=Enterococcus casseliflavus TaxID=37734 RepID=UPI0035DE3651